jgi:GT2 family glycosyltransferase
MTRPEVSVVIPTYRRQRLLARALDSLRHQTLASERYEVVVAVDGSEDDTREMLASLTPPYRLRWLWQPNRGRAHARNAGIRLAEGSLVVLLDDDMDCSPGFLRAHVEAHAGADRVGVLGASPFRLDADSPPLARFIAAGFQRRLDAFGEPGHTIGFREVYTGNLSLAREVFLEVGGFDEGFTRYGHEDYELALRLSGAGIEFRYCAEARAFQGYDKDFAAVADDSVGRGANDVYFMSKHPEARAHLTLGRERSGSRRWRATRSTLLALTRILPATPRAVIAAVTLLERRWPAGAHRYYGHALDYFYWLGVGRQRDRGGCL